MGYNSSPGGKDLKSKSIAAALERVSLNQWFFNFFTILPILDILKNQITPTKYIFDDQYTYK